MASGNDDARIVVNRFYLWLPWITPKDSLYDRFVSSFLIKIDKDMYDREVWSVNRYKNILYIVMPEMFKILMPHLDYLSPKRINDFENAIKKKKGTISPKIIWESTREWTCINALRHRVVQNDYLEVAELQELEHLKVLEQIYEKTKML